MGRVENKVVIITGAASGLGAADARMLRREGAKLILTDINIPAGEALAEEIGAAFFPQDVSEEDSWQALMDFTVATYGRLDGLLSGCYQIDEGLWRRIDHQHVFDSSTGRHSCLPGLLRRERWHSVDDQVYRYSLQATEARHSL